MHTNRAVAVPYFSPLRAIYEVGIDLVIEYCPA